MKRVKGIHIVVFLLLLTTIMGCSTKKNTAGSRFYQSFTTRYNVYFNGNEAYKDGLLAIQQQNKDNYMRLIPLYPIGNAKTVGTGKSNFERAIEKSQKAISQHSIKRRPVRKPGTRYTEAYKQWLKRGEFNPFLHNAWMLMGKAQFHKGDFIDAVATFSYIMRLYAGQPKITSEAGIWLARCYTELNWYYEAEDVMRKLNNDSLPDSQIAFYTATYGNILLEEERFREALPYLQKTIKGEKNRKAKARQYYLLGQVFQQLEENNNAFEAYGKVIKMNPEYELSLNARIRQTEVISASEGDKTIKKLRRMAGDYKNIPYLDQLHYALGNIYLARKDTVKALVEYKEGVEKSTRNGVEKGILQLKLGNLCWVQKDYVGAQQAYADAISLIEKDHPDYKTVNKRSEVLDELVTYTTAIHLQDSLQHLATLSEPERIAAVERVIEEIARREEEARKAEERLQKTADMMNNLPSATPISTPGTMGETKWYFYNQQLVSQGKTDFQRKWGQRKLEDNWRRKNKTVVALDDFEVDYSEQEDSLTVASTTNPTDSTTVATSSEDVVAAGGEENEIEFYLSQIPLTEEAMTESNKILSDALYGLGLLYKDKLDEFALSERTLMRLIQDFPDYPEMDYVYYNLYLLYARWEKPTESERYKDELIALFPDSKYALLLSDPEYRYNAMHGKHLEDSLYANTYTAYQQGDYRLVAANNEISRTKYPLGKHRPKFMFLHAVTQLQEGNQADFLTELKELVQNYPENEITELAAYILKGVQEGRSLSGGTGSFGSIWERRQTVAQDEQVRDSLISAFSADKQVPSLFILAYETGTVNENELLYEVARYNFSNFIVKNFELSFVHERGIGMLQVRSFMSIDEARQYQRQLYANASIAELLKNMRAVIISEENYELLMKYYSFEEYDMFYQEQLASDYEELLNLDYIEFDE
ncbi:hypothetical protein D0T50_12260 [Bacteroides sp. 214]|uniref:type IX secretion system periplasmic lipoprotein PorW/SprE n=1 Tax=Bacteroides sp. 214 TaxID=2302935 RepID=UPI0013D2A7CD|nr:tetratricopeptide repeat protein [Bacteroides sp. 214]NDW13657.1 hypothetical protein [Bacteroides sp. 214]